MRSSIVFLLSICLFTEAIVNSLVGIITHPSTATILYSLEAEVVIDVLAGVVAVWYWFSSRPDYSTGDRPLGVAVLAVLTIFYAIVLAGEGFLLLLIPIIGALGVLAAGLGVGLGMLARGLWNGKFWAWEIIMILTVGGIVVSSVLLPYYGYGAPILALFQFWYLRRPHVRNYFQNDDHFFVADYDNPLTIPRRVVSGQ